MKESDWQQIEGTKGINIGEFIRRRSVCLLRERLKGSSAKEKLKGLESGRSRGKRIRMGNRIMQLAYNIMSVPERLAVLELGAIKSF